MNTKQIITVTTLLALTTACNAGFESGYDFDRRVSTLSEGEARTFCFAASRYIDSQYEPKEWTKIICADYSQRYMLRDSCEDSYECEATCEQDRYNCEGDADVYGKTYVDTVDCRDIDDYDYEDCFAYTWEVEECVMEFASYLSTFGTERTCQTASSMPVELDLSPRCFAILTDDSCNVLF